MVPHDGPDACANQRVLHGREDQALGERRLRSAYADRDKLLKDGVAVRGFDDRRWMLRPIHRP